MRLQVQKGTVDGFEWRCRNQSKNNRHDVVQSVRKGTWFSESKLAITIILRLTRYWFGMSMNAFVVNNLKVNKKDVTCDGTWLTRGNSSQIGVGCVIDLLTEFVMDFEIMSKRCIACGDAKSGLGENSAEFHVLYEGHIYISSCAIDHIGSSCAMEQEAALKLWQISVDNDFRYSALLLDGDAKTYQYSNTKEVYGPEIKKKVKEEGINHVSKRLGTYLRKADKEL
ncbi:uncharacterized protein TNCV_3687421 [Trichonephila clavipes]|nr:uncharacterized protein TNCV_3687421 [Trichonephila clavipes]